MPTKSALLTANWWNHCFNKRLLQDDWNTRSVCSNKKTFVFTSWTHISIAIVRSQFLHFYPPGNQVVQFYVCNVLHGWRHCLHYLKSQLSLEMKAQFISISLQFLSFTNPRRDFHDFIRLLQANFNLQITVIRCTNNCLDKFAFPNRAHSIGMKTINRRRPFMQMTMIALLEGRSDRMYGPAHKVIGIETTISPIGIYA